MPNVAVVVGRSQWLWRRGDRLEMCSEHCQHFLMSRCRRNDRDDLALWPGWRLSVSCAFKKSNHSVPLNTGHRQTCLAF